MMNIPAFKKDRAAVLRLTYYFSLVVLFIGWRILHESKWIFGGEMFAEMATNYLPNTLGNKNIVDLLFATDAGYIPLPPRIIALVGRLLGLSVSQIPYFYTWSALLLTPLLVGTFVLKSFRSIIRDDKVRFLVAAIVLLGLDFQTRVFFNFPYTVLFVFLALGMVAMDPAPQAEFPRWSWILLPFAISKPYVLTLGPIMLYLAAFGRNRRIRIFFGACVILLSLQFFRMIYSAMGGEMANSHSVPQTPLNVLCAVMVYFFVVIGQFLVGPVVGKNVGEAVGVWANGATGILALGVIFFAIFHRQKKLKGVVWMALSVVFLTNVINCVTLSNEWNTGFNFAQRTIVDRHTISIFFACVLMASIFADRWAQSRWPARLNVVPAHWRSIVTILGWFFISGWYFKVRRMSVLDHFPLTDVSDWQRMAPLIEANDSPFCIPINPYGWFCSRNTELLGAVPDWQNKFIPVMAGEKVEITELPFTLTTRIYSAGIVVRPHEQKPAGDVGVHLTLETNEGFTILSGVRKIEAATVIMATAKNSVSMVKRAWLSFDRPIEVLSSEKKSGRLGVIWFGINAPE